MRSKLFSPSVAMEDDLSGNVTIEKERVFYACITKQALDKAVSKQVHEQWQIRFNDTDPEGTLRVRKVIDDGSDSVTFTQTVKIKNKSSTPGDQDHLETTIEITSDMFDSIKLLSTNGMVKTRFVIQTLSGKKLEVDAFPLPSGELANWVKIDYEYKEGDNSDVDFPEGFTEIIDGATTDPEEKQFISNLYDELFLRKNK